MYFFNKLICIYWFIVFVPLCCRAQYQDNFDVALSREFVRDLGLRRPYNPARYIVSQSLPLSYDQEFGRRIPVQALLLPSQRLYSRNNLVSVIPSPSSTLGGIAQSVIRPLARTIVLRSPNRPVLQSSQYQPQPVNIIRSSDLQRPIVLRRSSSGQRRLAETIARLSDLGSMLSRRFDTLDSISVDDSVMPMDDVGDRYDVNEMELDGNEDSSFDDDD